MNSQRRVVISGIGPVSGLGIGIESTWQSLIDGQSAIAPIEGFDASGFQCQVASEVKDFKVRDYVPKSYRKATKVMARDIELAVAAADQAAKDAGLTTKGTDPDADEASLTYPSDRMGAHIGAGLIACDLDELTLALNYSKNEDGKFDIHDWGRTGMQNLTPLWLLKYLPNMLACHVTIIHDTQGPSNTITCWEASSGLSLGESLRVIQRGAADLCFCGGAESRLNPMAMIRVDFSDRLIDTTQRESSDTAAPRPFDQQADGTVLGEGGGILILEALETLEKRGGKAYAEIVSMGASQTVNRDKLHAPDPTGQSIANAINQALKTADLSAEDIDLVIPNGSGVPAEDASEHAGLSKALGDAWTRSAKILTRPMVGNLGPGAGALDIGIAAKALQEQQLPTTPAPNSPIDGYDQGTTPSELKYSLILSMGYAGQNVAVILKRMEK